MSKPKIVRYSSKTLAAKRAKGEDRTDWSRVRGMSAAAAARNARNDKDNPPLSARDFANAKIVRRGRPKSANPKQQVTLRLSAEVLAHYRARGAGWQSRIDADLKKLAVR
jgi:uncharacterized protein (DUF4415 family)